MNEPAQAELTLESLVAEVADEFMEHLERGERPDIEVYLRRYPQHATVLRQVLASLQMVRLSSGSAVPAAPPAVDDATGTLGDYRILREIGRGGMGVVYEAEQISLARRVALKVLPFAAALDSRHLQRFKNEAQAAAHLHHQNIVPVYGVGCERGVHYYAMQFIEGQTLAAIISELRRLCGAEGAEPDETADAPPSAPAMAPETPLPAALSTERSIKSPAFFRNVAELGVQAAEALEHAHQMGVVHRDIKPANLLIESGGRLWITDFGLAQMQTDTRLTLTGDLVGTLRYMSPEQALAKRVVVDQRTDLYSLGATLYELLTLEPVFSGRDRQELLRQIAFEEPKAPRRINKAVPTELETIVLKALEKNPADRYSTARELADDLQRFLKDEPIRAKRATPLQRLRKWARRHRPIVISALLAATVALTFSVAALAVSYVRVRDALGDRTQALHDKGKALDEKTRALTRLQIQEGKTNAALNREIGLGKKLTKALDDQLEEQRQTKEALYLYRIALADRLWWLNNPTKMEEILDECEPEHRQWEWYYLKRLCHKELLRLPGHLSIRDAAFSSDGKRIVIVDADQIKVADAKTGQQVSQQTDRFAVAALVGANGQRVVIRTSTGTKVWDLTEASAMFGELQIPSKDRLALSGDGQYLATRSSEGRVTVWDLNRHKELLTLPSAASGGQALAVSPNRLAVGERGTVKMWELPSGRELPTIKLRLPPVTALAFAPDGLRLAAIDRDGISICDPATAKEVLTLSRDIDAETELTSPQTAPVPAAFSPDGKRLVAVGRNRTVKVWDAVKGAPLLTLRGFEQQVRTLAFSPDGARLLTGGDDGIIRVWDAAVPQEVLVVPSVATAAFNPNSMELVSVCVDSTIKMLDAATGQSVRLFPGKAEGHNRQITVCPRGEFLAVAELDVVRVWHAKTGSELLKLQTSGLVQSLAFSPEGGRLATASLTGMVRIWEIPTGKVLFERILAPEKRPWLFYNTKPMAVAFCPKGRFLACGGAKGIGEGFIHIWNLDTGVERWSKSLSKPGNVLALCFAADGNSLASAHGDGLVRICDVATGKLVHELRGHTGLAHCVAYSPDSRRLATGAGDATVKIWDPLTGRELLTLRGHSFQVDEVIFGPDGKRLVSIGGGGARIWDAAPLETVP